MEIKIDYYKSKIKKTINEIKAGDVLSLKNINDETEFSYVVDDIYLDWVGKYRNEHLALILISYLKIIQNSKCEETLASGQGYFRYPLILEEGEEFDEAKDYSSKIIFDVIGEVREDDRTNRRTL